MKEIKIENLRSLKDTGWIELKPINFCPLAIRYWTSTYIEVIY